MLKKKIIEVEDSDDASFLSEKMDCLSEGKGGVQDVKFAWL